MNIVQLHERVRYWLDSVASPRFDSQDIDNGINSACNTITIETYGKEPMTRLESFQRDQKCRDTLGPIVKKATSISSGFSLDGNNVITIASSTDYNLLLSLAVTINSSIYSCVPLTYDIKNTIPNNPYRRPRTVNEPLLYYNEEGNTIKISHAFAMVVSDFELFYLSQIPAVNYGIEYTSTKNFVVGNIVYAVEETVYNAVTYKIGEAITIVAGVLAITSGRVVYSYIDCILRPFVHEKIAQKAAINCLISAGQNERIKQLNELINA